jgi:hypothetical protein
MALLLLTGGRDGRVLVTGFGAPLQEDTDDEQPGSGHE